MMPIASPRFAAHVRGALGQVDDADRKSKKVGPKTEMHRACFDLLVASRFCRFYLRDTSPSKNLGEHMGQGDVDAVLANLENDDWERFSVRLKRYAFACVRHQSWAEAEDISQTAFLQVIDPKLRTWNPETEPDLFTHLKALVRQEVSRRRMIFRRRRETPYEEEMPEEGLSTAAEAGVDNSDATPANNPYTPSHETTLLREERGGRILSLLRERYASDALMLKVLELLIARVDTMAEQAEHIGCTLIEVRNARVRLGDRVKRIEKELDAEGGPNRGN